MKILGIDYGKSKVGVAFADGPLAEPYKVLHVESLDDAVKKVLNVVQELEVEKVIVGISEGKMAEETKKFAETIRSTLYPIPLVFFDETLTTFNAQTLSREARIPQKKRHAMEDAYAAAIMLQNHLDSQS